MSTNPANNAVDVAINSTVTAVFNDQMNPQTLTDTTFTLRNDTVAVTGIINYSDSIATFIPSSSLSFGGVYTATITTGVENLSGITVEKNYEWSFTTEVGDTTLPQITSTNPADNAENVSVYTEITVSFNKAMNASTINNTTFTVADDGSAVPGNVAYEGTIATFSPTNLLDFGTDYTATITTGAEDITGNTLANSVSWDFTTEVEPDTEAPQITSTEPADEAENVPVATNISVTFNEAMNMASVQDAFTVSQDEGEDAVAGNITFSGNTATFNPNNNLNFATTVTATISTNAQDLAGNALERDFTWSFITGEEPDNIAPKITSIEPGENENDISVNTNISATFSEAMDQASVEDAFVVSQNGTTVAGTVAFSNNTATFNPNNNLNFESKVTVTISRVAQDLAGNNLASNFLWSFTTGKKPDKTAPEINSFKPDDNADDVPIATNITAVFSEAVNSETINTTNFSVSQGGSNVTGAFNIDGDEVTFNPSNTLSPDTEVAVTITTGVQDMAGNNLASNFSWSFTTEQESVPPIVGLNTPADGATDVPVNSNITVTFNEAMDQASVQEAFTVSQNGSSLEGTINFSGNTATFNPANNLAFNTEVTTAISTDAQDLAGNNLENEFTWSFTTEQETIPPVVESTNPGDDEVDVPVESNIAATFNEAMNSSTINENTFTVSLNGTQIAGDVTYSNGTATFEPSANLATGTTYGATITTGAQDVAGNSLKNNFNWNFRTEQESIPPVVNSTNPDNGDTDVPVNSNISAIFSEAMDQASVQGAFTVTQNGTNVTGTVSFNGNTAIFNPANNLNFDNSITATISTAARDLAGNNLENNFSWNFTTEQESIPPVVNLVNPENNSENVSVTTNISVGFSEAMNSSTVNNSTFTVNQNGNAIPGNVNYSGNTAVFNPDNNLPFGSTITATVTTGVEDLAGNNLQSNYTWSFNTEQETTPPEVSSTDPDDGETDAPISSNISATFSEEMDQTTIDETTFTVSQEGTPISGIVSYSGTTATFNPTSDLTFDANYTATITTGTRDLAGNALETDYSWSFNAEHENIPPEVIDVDPTNNATNVSVNTEIEATFSEAMDASTINLTNFNVVQGSFLIPGTVEYSDNTATFTPAEQLTFDRTYNVIITTGVLDLVGNALSSEFQWSFTTENSPTDVNDDDD